MILTGDCKIRLAAGATMLAEYTEWQGKYHDAKRADWLCEVWLGGCRLTCQQAYDEKAQTPRNRVWMRKRVCEMLDAIAPGWAVVLQPNASGQPRLADKKKEV